jgi:hypothetical protein
MGPPGPTTGFPLPLLFKIDKSVHITLKEKRDINTTDGTSNLIKLFHIADCKEIQILKAAMILR